MRIRRSVWSLLAVGLCLLGVAWSPAYAGSPFYLTVEKSFANTEKPLVRLDYTVSQKPMLVRVLRPRSLERFLEGQFQISRSYEQPVSELNPGYFFITGLNQLESPLKVSREMLDVDFRKSFKDSSFNKAILDASRGDLATRPEQVIHGPPAGFTVVREYFVDLEYGGKNVSDLGWWFADSGWREDRYQIRKIQLDPLPDGVYLVQAVQGKTEAQCLMQVSSLSVQVKQSSEQLVVRVVTRDLEPVSGASVSYRDSRGKWFDLGGKTNEFGELQFSSAAGSLDGKLVIKAETPDKRQALVNTDFLPTTSKDNSVFIVTDRPIFKPGETFFYKGVIRSFLDGQLKMPDIASKQAHISLIQFDGTATDLQGEVPVSGHGSFSGSFGLDESQPPGIYRLVANIDDKPYGGEFRVRDYVKPTFYLELLDRSPTIVPGERFTVKFRAKRYAGGAPKGLKYEVFLYRKKFEAPQWVVEAGGGLSAGSDYLGEVRSASALMEPKRIYSSIEARLAEMNTLSVPNTWDSAPATDESGEARFEFDLPKMDADSDSEWTYTLMVRAMDRAGAQAVLTENIFVTLSEAQPSVRFSDTVAEMGEKGKLLLVRSTYPDGKATPSGGGVVDITLEQIPAGKSEFVKLPFTTDEKGVCQLSLPELRSRGRLSAVATLETISGKPMKHPAKSQPAVLIVGGAQGEAVVDNRELELYTTGTILSPGEKARVFALLPTEWGRGGNGTIWETIAGRKIFETRSAKAKGRSRWFEVEAKPECGTGFYHTVTVPMGGGRYQEQTLGFRVIPWNKRLTIAITPERDDAVPLKPLKIDLEVKDHQGAPAADTELSVTIVDRAVYAVQSELRPGIFDFFYPLPRLNLATFYSDELQGYGYADILKKPNFKLGALKSQSKLAKKAMRDTAGWFPHVVTDSQGRASITVDLPANVTEWLITAIAADKGGRVGESKGKFRTVTDVSVDVLAPQFLRDKEEVTIQLRTVNHLSQEVALRSQLGLEGEASLKAGRREGPMVIGKQGENLLPLTVEATGAKGMATLRVALDGPPNIHIGGAEEFEIPLKPATMRQTFSGVQNQNRLIAQLPEAAAVEELKVQVNSGLLGAALNAATVLVAYPYGCTEQLVHSTIPNLVLLNLVNLAEITDEQLGPLAVPLTKAKKNAAVGIKKIIRNQKTDGGFGLWPSDPNPSLPVTLTALYALKFAKELHIEGSQRAYNKGVDWLESLKGAKFDQLGVLFGYELSRFAEIGLYDQPWKLQIAFVEGVQADPNASITDLIYALRIFAGHKEKSWSRFNESFKNTSTKEILIQRLRKALEQFEADSYVRTTRTQWAAFSPMGFCFGVPYLISAGMGVLDELEALPEDLSARLTRVLMTTMRNGYWVSTFDTAQVIFNLHAILSREAGAVAEEEEANPRRLVARKKDGGVLGELKRIPQGFVGIFAKPGMTAGLSEVIVDGIRPNEVAYSTVTANVPFASVKARSNGLKVERSFRRVTATGSEKLEFGKPLRKGDMIVSEVLVKRDPVQDVQRLPSEFIVIEDGIPSFAQAVDDDEKILADAMLQPRVDSYWASIKETLRYPDKTVRIAKVMPTGEIKLFQVWRVAFPGKATISPATAHDMYDESLQANSEARPAVAE
ncbi:MAG TPA: alpha-2-macroglobulin [Syntrophobacteraceae bacterium]|nr:alpha-2-macroglobulin [Syntrophobacteraceae bacterium]